MRAPRKEVRGPEMRWSWRKVFNFGPLRVNLSKRGVGYSLGLRGIRIGRDAKGQRYTQTSIPKTGIYQRRYFGQRVVAQKWTLPALLAIFLILLLVKWLLR